MCIKKSLNFGKLENNKGYTLSEVLITLTVIGIIAAMTLPTLISKYQEKVLLTSFLRVYNILSSSYKLALNQYGAIEDWNGIVVIDENGHKKVGQYNDKDFIYNAFSQYMPVETIYTKLPSSKTCLPETKYYLNGNTFGLDTYTTTTVMLKSGECINFGAAYPSLHSFFWVDLNGKKKPNTLGKDQFLFGLAMQQIAPFAWSDTSADCLSTSTGKSCGAWIVRKKNMEYLHISDEEIKANWRGNSRRYWDK